MYLFIYRPFNCFWNLVLVLLGTVVFLPKGKFALLSLVHHCDTRKGQWVNPKVFLPSPLVTRDSHYFVPPHIMLSSNLGVNSDLIQNMVQTL